MAEILQIIPAHPNDRVIWNNDGEFQSVTPTCLALVRRGNETRIVYMEMVDSEIVEVDTDDKDFVGFFNTSTGHLKELTETFEARKKANGKSK